MYRILYTREMLRRVSNSLILIRGQDVTTNKPFFLFQTTVIMCILCPRLRVGEESMEPLRTELLL